MNLNELRDKAYRNAVAHGFHDKELSNEHCLCLGISELMEAVEADRKERFAKVPVDKKGTIFDERTFHYQNKYFAENFEAYIKDRVEDELADAVIRLFDLAGLRNINLNSALKDLENSIDDMAGACKDETFVETVYAIATLPARYDGLYDFATSVNDMIFFNIRACQSLRYRFALAHQSEDEIQ